jgi:hypothetical protein
MIRVHFRVSTPQGITMSEMKELVSIIAASDLGKEAAQQIETFLQNTLKEPAAALGGLFSDKINARRFKNLANAVYEGKRLLLQLGLTEKEVPFKIIHPLLECASLEEEPDLRSAWANLLANAADPREKTPVGPMFAYILRDLGAC